MNSQKQGSCCLNPLQQVELKDGRVPNKIVPAHDASFWASQVIGGGGAWALVFWTLLVRSTITKAHKRTKERFFIVVSMQLIRRIKTRERREYDDLWFFQMHQHHIYRGFDFWRVALGHKLGSSLTYNKFNFIVSWLYVRYLYKLKFTKLNNKSTYFYFNRLIFLWNFIKYLYIKTEEYFYRLYFIFVHCGLWFVVLTLLIQTFHNFF